MTIGGILADFMLIMSMACLLISIIRIKIITNVSALVLIMTAWILTALNVVFRISYVLHTMYGLGKDAEKLQFHDIISSVSIPILISSLLTGIAAISWLYLRKSEIKNEGKIIISLLILAFIVSILAVCQSIGLLKII